MKRAGKHLGSARHVSRRGHHGTFSALPYISVLEVDLGRLAWSESFATKKSRFPFSSPSGFRRSIPRKSIRKRSVTREQSRKGQGARNLHEHRLIRRINYERRFPLCRTATSGKERIDIHHRKTIRNLYGSLQPIPARCGLIQTLRYAPRSLHSQRALSVLQHPRCTQVPSNCQEFVHHPDLNVACVTASDV